MRDHVAGDRASVSDQTPEEKVTQFRLLPDFFTLLPLCLAFLDLHDSLQLFRHQPAEDEEKNKRKDEETQPKVE